MPRYDSDLSDKKLPAKNLGGREYGRRAGRKSDNNVCPDGFSSEATKKRGHAVDRSRLYPDLDKSTDDSYCAMGLLDRSDLTTCAETKSISDSSMSLQVNLLDWPSKESVSCPPVSLWYHSKAL